MVETSKKRKLENGIPLSDLKGEERPLSASLPLSTLLDSPRIQQAKEQMKTMPANPVKEVMEAKKAVEAPATESVQPESKTKLQYIDPSAFRRDFLYKSDLQIMDDTLADGNWWTYKTMEQKTGIATSSLHQVMVRLKKAIPSIIVKDFQSSGTPIKSHPVKIKLPDSILPMIKGVIDFERSEFNPQKRRRKTKPRTDDSAESVLFGDKDAQNVHKLNNVETDTSNTGSSVPEEEASSEESSSITDEVEALLGVKADDVKGSTLSKIIGDMSLDEVRKAINSYKLRQAQRLGLPTTSSIGLSQILEEEIMQRRLHGNGGGSVPSTPTAATKIMDALVEGAQAKVFMNILGPGLFGDQGNKGGGKEDMDVKSLLELMTLVDNIRGKGENKSDVEKLAELMAALKTFTGGSSEQQTQGSKAVEELKDYLKGIFEDKTTRDKQLEAFDKKLDDLIKDKDKKETQEQFQSKIEEIKEALHGVVEQQQSNKVDPIATFLTLQESMGKYRTDADERLSALRLEIEKQKGEAVQRELERLSERINDAAKKSSEPDQTVASIRGAVTDLITENLKKVANLGRTPEDIETKRMEQLKDIINPAIGTLKDTILKPVGDGIGDAIREGMKRQATAAATTATQPAPNLVPTPAQTPSAQHPPVAPAPPVEEKKKPLPYYIP